MARVQASSSSRADVADILRYLRLNSRQGARRVHRAIDQTFSFLAENPFAGPSRTEFGVAMRSYPVRAYPHYLVFYLPLPDGVQVVRVMHGARNLPRFF